MHSIRYLTPISIQNQSCPPQILRHLPYDLAAEIESLWRTPSPEEICLRRAGQSCLYCGDAAIPLSRRLSGQEMDDILNRLCGGSMYAHQDTLRQGYLTLPDGIRVGVCGRMRTDGGRPMGILDVSSLVFRIPRAVSVPTETVCRLLSHTHLGRGTLIYSPPGVGKTTLLRALIPALSAPPYRLRLAVIDTREELSACGTRDAGGVEWLIGYPRAAGIEIATRTLAPQLIVCDEIGDASEAEAICAACNAGVPLLATAHGGDVRSLLRRPGLRQLHAARIFGSYVGLSRPTGGGLTQRVTTAQELCGFA